MDVKQKIEQNIKESLKRGDKFSVSVLRMTKSALDNRIIELRVKKKELDDEEALAVIAKEVKKRKDSIDAFKKGGRMDLAEKEEKELAILEEYLPKQLSEEEIKLEIEKIIQGLSEVDAHNFGRVIGEVMKQLKGKADGDLVGKVVRETLKNLETESRIIPE